MPNRVLTQKSSGPEALISAELNQNASKDKEGWLHIVML